MKKSRCFSRQAMVWLLLFGCAVAGEALQPTAAGANWMNFESKLTKGGDATTLQPTGVGENWVGGLSVSDCIKCHKKEPAEIDARGMAHQTRLDCLSCHKNHRPRVANNIPSCNDCHKGRSHYDVIDCKNCHNPHAPLDVTLQGDAENACLSCHETVYKMLAVSKAGHRKLSCVNCHKGEHKFIPQCSECHGMPHTQAMHKMFPRCAGCHNIAHDLN